MGKTVEKIIYFVFCKNGLYARFFIFTPTLSFIRRGNKCDASPSPLQGEGGRRPDEVDLMAGMGF